MDILKVALTAVFSAAALFGAAKLMGRRQISQLDIFDYVTGITIGSIAAELATELETPLRPFVALVVYTLITLLLNTLTDKYRKTRKFINGSPTVLMDKGRIYRENLKKCSLDLSEFLLMCRQAGYFDLSAIQTAVFEYNGKTSFLPVSAKRPATPEDMSISPPRDCVFRELIMDGMIMTVNLKSAGLNEKWLSEQLKKQGYSSEKDIFLALLDDKNNLSLYAPA